MTAEDVKFSFERYLPMPAGGKEAAYKGDFAGLTGVEITGKYSGKINLSKPNAGLYAVALSDNSGCIISKKAFTERGADYNTKPVGSGPYQIVSLETQREVVLKRNPDYKGLKPAFDDIRSATRSSPFQT